MTDNLVCILESGSLTAAEEQVLVSAPGLTLRRGTTGSSGCLLFSRGGTTIAFLSHSDPNFDENTVQRCQRAAKAFKRATLLLPYALIGSKDLLKYHETLSHLDNFTIVNMPMGVMFAAQALEHAHAFFQGATALPTWQQSQTDVVTSSEAAARILSTLPLLDSTEDAKTNAEDALHRGRMLRMELGSLAALSMATPAQLQAAGLSTQTAMALQTFFTSKPDPLSTMNAAVE